MTTRIIIPTYNECENITPLLAELLATTPKDTRILVIDDNSPDGTADVVYRFVAQDSRVSLLVRQGKLDLGSAYQTAFRKVLEDGEDEYIVTMDADFSHHPKYIPKLLAACRDHDLAVGSRYVPGGRIENWKLERRMLSWSGNFYVRSVTKLPIQDCTSGFSCMRERFLRKVPFEKITTSGYAWFFTLKMLFHRRGARITEIPITFTERRGGKSKISTHIIYEGLIEPWHIRFSRL